MTNKTITYVVPLFSGDMEDFLALFDSYVNQSVPISEMVIAGSSFSSEQMTVLKEFLYRKDPSFPIRLDLTSGYRSCGHNKRIGVSRAKGDLISIMDADDVPHRERNRYLQEFFQNQETFGLIHGLEAFEKSPGSRTDALEWASKNIGGLGKNGGPVPPFVRVGRRGPDVYIPELLQNSPIHFGHITITAEAARYARFRKRPKKGSDVLFVRHLSAKVPLHVIPDKLSAYRNTNIFHGTPDQTPKSDQVSIALFIENFFLLALNRLGIAPKAWRR